jgi:hypothetical protein
MSLFNRLIRQLEAEELQKALDEGLTKEEWHAHRAADHEAAGAAQAAEVERAAAERQRAAERERAEADALGQQLGLGASVRPAYAMRLSGLSARSRGTGTSRASIVHLIMLGRLERGRLRRTPGQFLCDARLEPFDVSYQPIDTPISCPRCRRIAGLDR